MIPVLIAPVINRFDLLERMLYSVDHPVDRTVIVDNSVSGWSSDSDKMHERLNVWYLRPLSGLGYGGAINQGIMQHADAPWWLWASNDVVFHPGTLAKVAAEMDAATGPRVITGGFTWGALNAATVDKVGLIDEWSFFPIYYDDNDYHYRCNLAGVEWSEPTGWEHGEDVGWRGSLAINSSPELRSKNNDTFPENTRRYIAKWGGMPGQEQFTSPWNTGWPLWVTKPDITGRAKRIW